MLPAAESALNCTEGIQWISTVSSECVDTGIKLVGFAIGFISILLWFLPVIPQVRLNYRLQHCRGLSMIFILLWLFGDISNAIGTDLTNQTTFQEIICFFVILLDLVLLRQYVYYTYIFHLGQRAQFMAQDAVALFCVMLIPTIFCLAVTRGFSGSDTLGYVFLYLAALFCIGGRIPQILKNYRRQSCEGLSLTMLYILVSANITHGVSVLLGSDGERYFLRHLPSLVGSIGCCVLDIFMIYQFYLYGAIVIPNDDLIPPPVVENPVFQPPVVNNGPAPQQGLQQAPVAGNGGNQQAAVINNDVGNAVNGMPPDGPAAEEDPDYAARVPFFVPDNAAQINPQAALNQLAPAVGQLFPPGQPDGA